MNLRHLTTFVTIVESGTLTEAARRLYKTQGAVSHDLKELESALGLALIDRSGQRIQVTAAGETLLPVITDVLRRVREVERVGRKLREGELGVVRVGTLPSLGTFVLAHLVEFQRSFPDVRFTLFTELQTVLADWLADGRIDLVLAQPELSSRLEAHTLDAEEAYVVVPSDDPLAERDTVCAEDLVGRPFIGFVRDTQSTRLAEEFFRPVGRYPDPAIEVEDFRLMAGLIRQRLGIGLMPASALVAEAPDDLIGLRTSPALSRPLVLLTDIRQRDSSSVTALRDQLLERWRAPVYGAPAGGAAAQ
ncbi:LysR family transcriptional regulator [Conexibacter woesei]|uniref:Transcriptional regulator, LysR family n=1 Tax=Conexibacter woesei (strain DSM 14684 / CCUG 47730 / CIP 108061 / JCM 11494 / NBRC 100937 / ID131577) TaxID=469383 RepID=D3F4F4_CONWI|nr:LysR family transcriptional regulator [Conexibacter woesei]ADB50526.1 transcriptional regulator, LysR family [Conexibacter woesei DSM 14684]